MFRKWLVSVVAAAFLTAGFLGCEETPEGKKEPAKPKTAGAKAPGKSTVGAADTKGPKEEPKTPAPETKPEPKKEDK